MKTGSDYYDMFVARSVDYAEIAAMDLDAIASDVTDLVGDAYAEGDYPRFDDGMVAVYAIAEMIQSYAAQCAQDAEADRWEEHQRVWNR